MNQLKEIVIEIDKPSNGQLKFDLNMSGLMKDPILGEYESKLINTFYTGLGLETIGKMIDEIEGKLSLVFNNDFYHVRFKPEQISTMVERIKEQKSDDKLYIEYLVEEFRFRVYSQAYGGIELLPKKSTENTLISVERVQGLSNRFQTEEIISINSRYAFYNQY